MILDEPAGPDPIMRVPIRGRQGEVRVKAGYVTTEAVGSTVRKRRCWL